MVKVKLIENQKVMLKIYGFSFGQKQKNDYLYIKYKKHHLVTY